MKRQLLKNIIFILITLIFVSSASTATLASTSFNITKEISELQGFYGDKTILEDWYQTIVFASAGLLDSRVTPFIPDLEAAEGKSIEYAKYILASLAVGQEPDTEAVEFLKNSQDENGSFGTVYDQIYSILALDALKEVYQSKEAVSNLVSLQFPDGGFSYEGSAEGDLDTTGLSLTVLARYKDDIKVKETIGKAIAFIKGKQQPNGGFIVWGKDNSNTLAAIITGLVDVGEKVDIKDWHYMVESLQRFQNPDGSYRYSETDAAENNELATIQCFMALDAYYNESSAFSRLAEKGNLDKYELEDYIPLVVFLAVMLVFSVIFWIIILTKKKKERKVISE